MTEAEKIYILTSRQGRPEPADWQSRIADAPGVTLIATTGRYLRVQATPNAIQTATAPFDDAIITEEELPRYL